ncbi:AAA family ATPase [Brevibacillus thermoruber]|uniref:AAA family ATPase n=2 Tax=Brevibacillus TaxID=55080 RepID=A0A9X3Z255_9BACL|nr:MULTISPECIES: AAA family ATPase [Brevibacillus]MDA5107270.1 AAA family ATPase [Brevibacillus thermoruber]UYZ15545.1 AAA family ATPase [Brevibacillus sp. WF146]
MADKAPHRIQVVFRRPEKVKRPETLADTVRTTAPGNVAAAFDELERLIGLREAKKLMYEIHALLRLNKEREKHNLKLEKQVYHMVFKGNPGTGKTTVARLFGKLFREMGILSKGHLIEVERADLVGEFIGHTAQKTRDLIKKALGGILFIDEAYSLARGGEKDFGKEAIDCLTKALEDHGNDFVCILAGYTDEMDAFLELNPGLPSRFPIQLRFADYTVDELISIAESMVEGKEYRLSPSAKEKLRQHLMRKRHDVFEVNFSNARYVRNAIEQAIRKQAVRLLAVPEPTRDDVMTLQPEDFVWSAS